MNVYVLREDMYHEWLWENGATNLIMVSDNIETITCELRKYLNMELEEDNERILQDKDMSIDDIIDNARAMLEDGHVAYVDVYINDYNYNNGCNHGTFVIERMEVR